jgi:hypothetical protein
MTLTVSERRDASRIVFDPDALPHVSYLVFSALARIRFSKGCIGKRFHVRVSWQPGTDWSYGYKVRNNDLTLTAIQEHRVAPTRRTHRN